MPKKGFDEEAEKRRIAAAEMADKVRKEEAARRQAEEEERIFLEQEAKREAEEKRALEIHNSHFERYRRSGVIVHMISNGVGDREASELARALKEKINPNVRQFDLSNNTISDSGAKALAAALADDFSLHELRLSGNVDIGDDGVRALADALTHNTTLRSMQLTGCTLNDVSIVALANALRANARLNELQLHRSAGIVTDVGVRALALALCAPDTPLTALTLAGAQISEKGMVYLTRALLFNERLKQLSLGTLPVGAAAGDVTSASRLGEACVVSMRCALAVNAALTEYDGPGAPLLPTAERKHHRETYLFSKLNALKKPLSEETWACAIDVFGQKDLSIGEKINSTATADLHQATFKGQSVVAHGYHALREPFKHGLDEASMYASVVNMVSGQIASALTIKHRNIVCVLGCGYTSLRSLQVPRWVLIQPVATSARPLSELLVELGAMPTSPVDARLPFFSVSFQLALALAHLHGQACRVAETPSPLGRPPIEHGCIRSANILIDRDEEYVFGPKQYPLGFYTKLSQLALGRIDAECGWMQLSSDAYCAPETVPLGQVSCQRDMYAFGCVLLEMICGKSSPPTHEQRWLLANSLISRTEPCAIELVLNLLDADPNKRKKAAEVAEEIYEWIFGPFGQ